MDDLLESAAREVEELAASVDFDISEFSEDELTALPSLDEGTPDDDESAAPQATDTSDAAESAAPADEQPAVATGATGPAWMEATLNTINRPFAFLPPPVRRWVGLIAAVTLVTSLLFVFLRPLLFGQRDVVGELRASAERIDQQGNKAE